MGGDGSVLGFYGFSLVMFVMYSVERLVAFVIYFVRRVLWWLRGVGVCVFGHLIVIICMVHKYEFVFSMRMGKLSS